MMKLAKPDFDWTFIIYFLAGVSIGHMVMGLFR